jgi:hypothetical protein
VRVAHFSEFGDEGSCRNREQYARDVFFLSEYLIATRLHNTWLNAHFESNAAAEQGVNTEEVCMKAMHLGNFKSQIPFDNYFESRVTGLPAYTS